MSELRPLVSESVPAFEARKREHIEQSLLERNQARGLGGLGRVHLEHEALPEMDWDEVSLSAAALGQSLNAPFYVSSMTAGHPGANAVNLVLAEACESKGWLLGVGSQRRELFDAQAAQSWEAIRSRYPKLKLLGNIGLTQLAQVSVSQVSDLVSSLGAVALCVHTNPLQEALQIEGTPQFRNGERALKVLCEDLKVPVVLKEVGTGFSMRTLSRLKHMQLGAVDVSGLGGTHWGRIEGVRSEQGNDTVRSRAAQVFSDWGVGTWESLQGATSAELPFEIWASGGVRSGLDAAKLFAGGARLVGFAQPALEQALKGVPQVLSWMNQMEFELKLACFCTGSKTVSDLRGKWTTR